MKKILFVALAGTMLLAGCSGKSTPAANVAETTVAVAAPGTDAPVNSEAPKPDTTVNGDSSSTAPKAASQQSPTSLDLAAAAADPLAAIQGLLGITDPKDLDCIKSEMAKAPAATAGATPGVDPGAIKAVLTCQPPQVVALIAKQVSASAPAATPEQADCVAKATLTVLTSNPDGAVSALIGGAASIPAELKTQLIEKAKPCGLSDADLKKVAGL
jgi:hypothetical protein